MDQVPPTLLSTQLEALEDPDVYRRFWSAILLRAVRDTQAGDKGAALWLLRDAESWAGEVVGINFFELANFARGHMDVKQ